MPHHALPRFVCPRIRQTVAGLALAVTLAFPAARAFAQPDRDQLQTMYDDAVRQLQAAQDRRNELATENEQLKARIAELEKDVARQREEIRQAFVLWEHYAAWREVLLEYPAALERFRAFLSETSRVRPDNNEPLSHEPPELYDSNWPFSAVTISTG